MGPDFYALSPVVKQHADPGSLHQRIEPVPADLHPGVEAVLPEKHRRTPEAGARVAVEQGQLPLVIADQRLRLRLFPQDPQGVVGSDPAAARGRRGPKAVAQLVGGDAALAVDQILHSGCSSMNRSSSLPAVMTIFAQGRLA